MSINDYFETIKGMAVEGAQAAAKKTKQVAGIAKANLDIHAEEEKIKKAQIELGKLYYKDYIVGENPDPAEYNPWCEKISESKIAIEDLKIAIEDLKTNGAAQDAAEESVPAEAPKEEGDAPVPEAPTEAPKEEADAPASGEPAQAEEKAE